MISSADTMRGALTNRWPTARSSRNRRSVMLLASMVACMMVVIVLHAAYAPHKPLCHALSDRPRPRPRGCVVGHPDPARRVARHAVLSANRPFAALAIELPVRAATAAGAATRGAWVPSNSKLRVRCYFSRFQLLIPD